MFHTLKELFNSFTASLGGASAPDSSRPGHVLQLAAAVLMIEVMRADGDWAAEERQAAFSALRTRFALGEDEVARLLELAETTSREAPDLYSFTSQLNNACSLEQKTQIFEYLWQVAYADGHLSPHENHLLLKLGALLHMPRGEFVAAKQRGRQAAGVADPGSSDA